MLGRRRASEPLQEPPSLLPLLQELERLPQSPVTPRHPRYVLFRIKRGLDFVGHAKPASARLFRHLNPYPKPFRHVWLRTEDGVRIAGWFGPPHKDAPAPPFGLVIVPGMFSTKDDTVHKRRAIRIWRHWRIPVLCIDLRAFGESNGIATAGWKEALDVMAAARFLRSEAHVDRVGVLAESMGGAAALNAVAHDHESGSGLLWGGTLTWSAFVDAADAVAYISAKPPAGHPFERAWNGFRRLLRYLSQGGYERFDEYLEDAAQVNGLEGLEALTTLANPKWKVAMMRRPVLLVHATDDPVVPVRHARRMQRYARDDPHIQTLITSWGGHTGFESLDPWWTWEVMRRFFGHVNGVELPNPEDPKV